MDVVASMSVVLLNPWLLGFHPELLEREREYDHIKDNTVTIPKSWTRTRKMVFRLSQINSDA